MFEAAKHCEKRRYTTSQFLGDSSNKKNAKGGEEAVVSQALSGNSRDNNQRGPMRSLVLSQENDPKFHF